MWTRDMDRILTAGWSQGLSEPTIAVQIAEAVGGPMLSRSAVSGRRRRLGLPARPAAVRRETTILANQARRKPHTPPKPSVDMRAFDVSLPGTTPRPWQTRKWNECAWPVGGQGEQTLSCCAPVMRAPGAPYCEAHCRMLRSGG